MKSDKPLSSPAEPTYDSGMSLTNLQSESCSMSRTLDIIGDRWTLLVLRDLFSGVNRFEDLREHLGIARDVLSRRLAALVESGVAEKSSYQEKGDRTRFEYHLTTAGRELRPVLVAIMDWGDRHVSPDGPPLVLEHVGCGSGVHAVLTCEDGHQVTGKDIRAIIRATALMLL